MMVTVVSALLFGWVLGMLLGDLGESSPAATIHLGHVFVMVLLTGGFWALGWASCNEHKHLPDTKGGGDGTVSCNRRASEVRP